MCDTDTSPESVPQAGGALIGPHALGIIKDVEGVRHLAELGVVFLLFNIGLELSLERLQSMQRYVFGMGTAQVSFVGAKPGDARCTPKSRPFSYLLSVFFFMFF